MINIQEILKAIKPYVLGWIRNYWVYLDSPLTSTDWDGDSFSTTAKTLIDLSVKFGVPAGVRAVKVRLLARDLASAGTNDTWFGISPNNTANSLLRAVWPGGKANDAWDEAEVECKCNSDGDIYYQCVATGSGSMDVVLEIWGYLP